MDLKVDKPTREQLRRQPKDLAVWVGWLCDDVESLKAENERLENYETAILEALRGSGNDPETTDPYIWIDGLLADLEQSRAENERLRAFRDAVTANMRENAGNLDNPFAYIWQSRWEQIKTAEAAGGKQCKKS